MEEVLGKEDGALFNRVYDVSEVGNFEGRNILHRPSPLEAFAAREGLSEDQLSMQLSRGREALKTVRSRREPPFRDEKVLVGWNSFVLRALAEAAVALDRPDYLKAAQANAAFLLASLKDGERLLRSWKDGTARIPAFLEDYAGLGNALLTLYEVTLEPEWLSQAHTLADQVMEFFWDEDEGVFFDTPKDGETLVLRPRDAMDNATPSGNSLAAELLFRASVHFGEDGFRRAAVRSIARETEAMKQFPNAFGRLLSVLSGILSPPVEVALLGDPGDPVLRSMLAATHGPYIPTRVVSGEGPSTVPPLPLQEGKTRMGKMATAYVCRNFACTAPLQTPESVADELAREVRKPRE